MSKSNKLVLRRQGRQGDVLVQRVKSLPKNVIPETPDGHKIVLAYGEVTGHSHALADTKARSFTMQDAQGAVRRFLEVFADGAALRHEEHAPITLPAGIYEITIQREYSPEAIRNVAD